MSTPSPPPLYQSNNHPCYPQLHFPDPTQVPSMAQFGFFGLNQLPPRLSPNCTPPLPQTRYKPPQIGSLYPIKRPPVMRSRKLSPSSSVFGFWPKSPHPRTRVDPHLPALKPRLTPNRSPLPKSEAPCCALG